MPVPRRISSVLYAMISSVTLTISASAREPAAKAPPSEHRTRSVERYVGGYAFSGGDQDRAKLAAQIDAVVSRVNLLKRAFVRRRLEKATAIDAEGAIDLRGNDVTVVCGEKSYTAPLDGDQVEVEAPDGGKLKLRYRYDGHKLIQRFDGDEVGRQNVFVVDDDGHLRITVRLWSSHLPRPLTYVLHYRRRG